MGKQNLFGDIAKEIASVGNEIMNNGGLFNVPTNKKQSKKVDDKTNVKFVWFQIKKGKGGIVLKVRPKANEPFVDIFLSFYQGVVLGKALKNGCNGKSHTTQDKLNIKQKKLT